jgi:hypothetical protein
MGILGEATGRDAVCLHHAMSTKNTSTSNHAKLLPSKSTINFKLLECQIRQPMFNPELFRPSLNPA